MQHEEKGSGNAQFALQVADVCHEVEALAFAVLEDVGVVIGEVLWLGVW